MKITMNANEVSVCDGCSNWRICKFSKDVKRAEAEYRRLRENANWPECIESTLKCKYKQYIANRLDIRYDYADVANTGYPPFRSDEGATCNTVE